MPKRSAKDVREDRTRELKQRTEATESAKRWFVLVASVLALYEAQEELHIGTTWESFEKDFGPFPMSVLTSLTSKRRDDEALFWDAPVQGRPWQKLPTNAHGPWLTFKGRLFAKALIGCVPFMGKEPPKPGTRAWERAAVYVARHG